MRKLDGTRAKVISVSKDSGAGMTAEVEYMEKKVTVFIQGGNGLSSSPNVGDMVMLSGVQGNIIATPDYSTSRTEAGLSGLSADDFQIENVKTGNKVLQAANGDTIQATNGDWSITVSGDNNLEVSGNVNITCTNATVNASKVTVNSGDINLGADGGRPIARIGDIVIIDKGSSSGVYFIGSGSSITKDAG